MILLETKEIDGLKKLERCENVGKRKENQWFAQRVFIAERNQKTVPYRSFGIPT